jgi:Putative peptidoglycan binding domain
MPPRRRGAAAAAIDAVAARGLLLRLLLRNPKDAVAGLLAFAAASAIIANALFLQSGPHPAPMFGSVAPTAGPAALNLLPRPRPVEADLTLSEPRLAESKSVEPKTSDPLASLVKTTTGAGSASPSNVLRPPASIPPSRGETTQSTGSHRVAAVQRALTEYGYGQLKPSGTIGADTQAAIQKFERDRRMPATGQVSDRLVRELSAMIGHPID